MLAQVGLGLLASVALGQYTVEVDFKNVTGVSRTVTTLQVVSNPILAREFHLEDGSTLKNPIHDQAFESLAALGADLVRFVPWFPYPKLSVAELDAPRKGHATSWDFTNIIPQFYDFMAAVLGRNHSTVINFSTQPCWLFGDSEGKVQNCSYPDNPDQSFFGYVRGDRANLLDPTSGQLADYYARLLSWIILGEFEDEHGVKHTGGPKFDLSRKNGHVWELFNEAEHNYNVSEYTQDYDVVVNKMIKAVGEDRAPAFMGLGGADPSWITPFLNKSNHKAPIPPIDYFSMHFYAGCDNRTDPDTYPAFFSYAKRFVDSINDVLVERNASSFPNVKIDLDELGVIMPDDNDPDFDITGNLPSIYWNAAGAMYVYLYISLAPMGVEVLGHSQLAGSPKIPEWNIPLPQFPSVSLLDWRTGYGNARYWALKLLLLHFGKGDYFVSTKTVGPPPTCRSAFCGQDGAGDDYATVHLECCDPNDVIEYVQFADWGTVQGKCGNYTSNPNCTRGVPFVKYWVTEQCVGQHACDLAPFPTLKDPCHGIEKKFVAQVHCTGEHGGYSPTVGVAGVIALGIHANGESQRKDTSRKLLLINTENANQTVRLKSMGAATLFIVDQNSVQEGSLDGIRNETLAAGQEISMLPFAIVIADFA